MNSRNPAFPVVPQMLFPPSGAAGFIATTESTAHEETVDSVGAVHGLFSQLLPGDIRVRIWGALLVYGDPKPKPEGYFEFYDRETNLLAVGCFDRFGMQKLAIRRLFDGSSRLQAVFVTFSDRKAL